MAKKPEKENKGFFSWLGFGGSSKSKPSGNPPAPHNEPSLVLEPSRVSVDYKTQLGLGSFGRVYKGSYMGKPCAVKVFNTGVVKGDIAREAEVTSLIQHHENIVQVYGLWYGESEDGNTFPDGQPALVMELCSTNLKSYLDGKKKNPRDTHSLKDKLTILYQITLAMIYLHCQHIVHGDLSAANILLQISGQQPSQLLTAKVGDFGQARVLNPKTLKHLTKDHGKDDIMPPEVLKGDIVTLTIEVDVFSFGCLVPYVATCVYPKPAPMGLEFDRRKPCLKGVAETQQRIFLPLMEKCLADKSHLRGTFEDVQSMLGPQMNKFVKGTYSETEEEKTREIEKLKSNLLEYERKVKSLQEEKVAIEVSCGELEVEKKTLETTNKLLNVDLEDRISKVEQLEETLRQRDATIKDNNERQTLLERKWNQVEGVGTIFAQHQSLSEEKWKLEESNRQKDEQLSQLQYSCDQATTERDSLRVQVRDLEWKNGALKEEKKEDKRTIEQLRTRSSELNDEKEILKKRSAHLQVQLQICEKEKKTAEENLAASNRERLGLTTSLKSSSDTVKTSTEKSLQLQQTVDHLNGEVAKLKTAKNSLEKDLAASQRTEKNAKDQFEKKKTELARAQSTITTHETEIQRLKGLLEKKKDKVKELEHSVSDRERKLETKDKRVKDYQKEVDTLKAKLKSKEQDVNSLGRRLTEAKTRGDTAERQWGQLEGQLKTANTEIANLEKSERSLNRELESVKGERDNYFQEKTKLETEKAQLDKEVKLANQQLIISKEVSTKTTRELNDLRVRYEDLQGSNELLKKKEKEIEHLNQELEQSKAGHSKVVTEWENEKKNVLRLEEENGRLKEELKSKTGTVNDREVEVSWFKRKLKDLGDCVLPTSGDSSEGVESPPAVGEEFFTSIQVHVAKLMEKEKQAINYKKLVERRHNELQDRFDASEVALKVAKDALAELKELVGSREEALRESEEYQNKLQELLDNHEKDTKLLYQQLRQELLEVHSKLATNKEVMINMDRQHRRKMAELTDHVGQRMEVQLTQYAQMDNDLRHIRGELGTVRTLLESSHKSRLSVARELTTKWKRSREQCAALEDSNMVQLVKCGDLKKKEMLMKQEHLQEVAKCRDEYNKQEAYVNALESSRREEEQELLGIKRQLDKLSAEHAKCEQLKEREKKLRRREKKAKDLEDKLQSEKISMGLEMKTVEEMKQKFIHFLKKVEFTPSQVEELSQKLGQNLTQYFRDHTPVSSDSSSDQMDGTPEDSLATSDTKRELHLIISHKEKFNQELKAENEELLAKVEDLKRELRLKESLQHDSPVAKARQLQREWEQEKRDLIAKLDIWIRAYFLVQCYPFFIHDFHLRGLHQLAPNVQQLTSSEVTLAPVEVLHYQSIEGVFKTQRISLAKLFEAVVQAMTAGHSLSLSATFFHFAGSVTLYRFHIVVDPKVLVHDDPIHRCSDEGGAIPRAFFTYASVQLKDGVTPPHIKGTTKGLYYLTRMRGQVDLMTKSLGLCEQEEEGVIKLITDHLDGRIARHLDNRYASFAKPAIAIMPVPECHINEP